MVVQPLDLLWLALLGGWVAVDETSFGQFMISRPLIAATIAGWIVGDPAAGAFVGVILEAFHLAILPVGAARYPEGGPPAVVAGGAFAASDQGPVILLAVVGFALLWEWLGGESIRYMRHLNVGLVSTGAQERLDELERRHLTATALDVGRGVLLVMVGWPVVGAIVALARTRWGVGESVAGLVVEAVLIGLLASSVRLFGTRAGWFAAGAVAAAVLVIARS